MAHASAEPLLTCSVFIHLSGVQVHSQGRGQIRFRDSTIDARAGE